MKNSVSVTFYAPYEEVEFKGLRKALEFAIESNREADVVFNGALVWQSYDGNKNVEHAMGDSLKTIRMLEALYEDEEIREEIRHFRNTNIIMIDDVYAKKVGEACYDDNGFDFNVCCVYEDIYGNVYGYDPYINFYVDIERINLRTLVDDKNTKKRGRRSNSHNKKRARNKKLHAGFEQIEEDDLPF